MGDLTVKTNNVPRHTIPGYDLTAKERADFDYLDNVEDGTFFRYRGQLYDLGEFMALDNHSDHPLRGWHGYSSDSYFSGVAIRLSDDGESVVCATYYS